MSQISKGVFVAIAASLTLGAAQFAMGRDLAGISQAPIAAAEAGINRSAKTDRIAVSAQPALPTRTISLQLNGVSDTSVLIRMPAFKEARSAPVAPKLFTSPSKRTVACEPVVSVLTDVAKLLQPGRCVT